MPKNIFITGGSCDTASQLIDYLLTESKFNLIVQTRNAASITQAHSHTKRLSIIEGELKDHPACDHVWREVLKRYDTIDALVSIAAVSTPLSSILNQEWWDAWHQSMAVNTIAPAYLSMLLGQQHQKKGTVGKAIMLTSRAAHRGDDYEKMHYAASKAALANISKTLAQNSKKNALLTYNIAPGFVQTKRIEQTILPNKPKGWIEENFPLGELVNPHEIVELIGFLLSHDMHHMTGATFDINGATYIR